LGTQLRRVKNDPRLLFSQPVHVMCWLSTRSVYRIRFVNWTDGHTIVVLKRNGHRRVARVGVRHFKRRQRNRVPCLWDLGGYSGWANRDVVAKNSIAAPLCIKSLLTTCTESRLLRHQSRDVLHEQVAVGTSQALFCYRTRVQELYVRP
jgi:hypothetical protein